MADVKVTLKRVIDAQGNTDDIHPTTDWEQVENKPTTFTPTAHTLNSHTDVNASPSDGQVLTWDGTNSLWVAGTTSSGVSKTDLQNLYIYGKASAAITKGQAVQFDGAQGDHILIKPAVPSEINSNPDYMIGIAETSLSTNDFGYVLINGRLNLDTSSYSAGDILYFASAGSTAGALTTTEPTGGTAIIQLAAVTISGVGNGEFVVRKLLLSREIHEVIDLQDELDLKAPLASPALTGTPTAPTAAANTNTTQIATTAYVQQEITDLIGGAPGALDTLNELAAAINDDSSYASTITTALAGKVAKSGDTMTGNLNLQSSSLKLYSYQNTADAYRYIGTEYSSGNGNNKAEIRFAIDGADTKTRMQFHTANGVGNIDERMRITSSGNVGIGTTSPGEKLQVEGDVLISGTGGTIGTSGAITNAYLKIGTTLGFDPNQMLFSSAGYINSTQWLALGGGGDGTQTDILITSDHKVGIGTTSPRQKLDVVGKIQVSNGLTLRDNSIEQHLTNGNANVAVNYYGYANGLTQFRDFEIYNGKGGLIAQFDGSSSNVGIGTTSPAYKLDVAGTGQFLSDSSTQRVLYLKQNTAGTGNIIQFQGASAENVWELVGRDSNFYIYNNDLSKRAIYIEDSTNYIGLNNNTSPSHALDVYGQIRGYVSSTTTHSKIWSENGSTGQASLELKNSAGHFRTITSGGAYYVYDQTDGAHRFYIDTSGDFGIGTTTPSEKLDVNGTFKAGGFNATDSDQWPNFYWLRGVTGWDEGLIKGSSSRGVFGKAHFGIHFDDDRSFAFHTSGWDTEMEINGDGTLYMKGPVGIGTSSPQQKLQVNGDITVDRNATGSGATITLANGSEVAGNYSSLMFGNVNSHNNYRKGGIAYRTDGTGYGRGDIYFLQRTDATSTNADLSNHAMVIKNDGKVGIGTSSPSDTLHIEGNQIISKATTGGQNQIRFQEAGTTKTQITSNYGDNKFYLYHEGDNVMVIDSSSATTFSGDLTVQGDLTINGTTTTLDTTVSTTDQWTVTNAGTDVAAIINQTGTADILDVRDNGTSVFKVKDGGDVEMKTDSKFTVGASTTVNEAKIILDASNGGHPQIGLAENNDASWALGVDDTDNSFKIHGASSSTIPTIGGLTTPHLELDTTGNLWLQKRLYFTSNAYMEYNSTNDSIDFFFT